ncbi:hypothetical protein KSP39_PZI005086 [Platanthera zijinensis]|uniref:Terpene synthase metal-binding domain-containing protein n=1 Tax=Platanthera zijinensis TaxID=2320716 RepID=A0AAP0BR42_9ASPA
MTALHNPFLSCSNLLSSRSRAAGRTNNSAPHHLSCHVSNQPNSLSTVQDPSLMETKVHNKKPFLWKDFSQNDYDQVLRWWEQLELSAQQPHAFCNQPMKWFMWSMSALPDPHFSLQRIELSKVIALVYVVDDIFDLLGSLEELTLFTQAVERWDNSQLILLDSLPGYMKFCLHTLYTTTNEIADLIMKEHGLNPTYSLRKLWTSLFQAFLVEAEWFRCEPSPKAKEYLDNGVISSGVCVVLGHLNFLLGNEGNGKNIALLDDDEMPLLFSQAALLLRLCDDLESAGDENHDGFDGSYVDYYMKEHGVSLQNARKHTNQMISDAWTELNKEILSEDLQVSSAMKKATLNMVSMIKIMYNYDNQKFPILEE